MTLHFSQRPKHPHTRTLIRTNSFIRASSESSLLSVPCKTGTDFLWALLCSLRAGFRVLLPDPWRIPSVPETVMCQKLSLNFPHSQPPEHFRSSNRGPWSAATPCQAFSLRAAQAHHQPETPIAGFEVTANP